MPKEMGETGKKKPPGKTPESRREGVPQMRRSRWSAKGEIKMNTYTLEVRMYAEDFDPRFAFNATDEADAESKAFGWARYQGKMMDDVRVREATDHETEHWMHNEYIF